MDSLTHWCTQNGLKINKDKCKFHILLQSDLSLTQKVVLIQKVSVGLYRPYTLSCIQTVIMSSLTSSTKLFIKHLILHVVKLRLAEKIFRFTSHLILFIMLIN